MKNLKKFQLDRFQLQKCNGGGGPFDLGATDQTLTYDNGNYIKQTYSKGSCVGGGSTETFDREWYNSAGDLTSSKIVTIHNGGL